MIQIIQAQVTVVRQPEMPKVRKHLPSHLTVTKIIPAKRGKAARYDRQQFKKWNYD